MCIIYVAEEHNLLLDLWRENKSKELSVLHLDSHCDMRGLLIDRKSQRAYSILGDKTPVDQGNYLTFAITEGRIASLRWVNDDPGGRIYDVGTVKYETDFSAIPYLLCFSLKRESGICIDYKEMPFKQWIGLIEGEFLDIDWDFFASKNYPVGTINERVTRFLETDFSSTPAGVFLCYSPEYSHPTRIQFREFIKSLSKMLNANVIDIQPSHVYKRVTPFYRRYLPASLFRLVRKLYYCAILFLHKRGIH
ncbi:MAG: hypothetical protein Q7U53_15520 [Anaerolineaceae bacterium]|nr:hypothetical protein [Anaerolineaceae bacterium]